MMDDRLPQMQAALNPQTMTAVLSDEFLRPVGNYDLRSCRITYIRYKPGKTCLICYGLDVYDRDLGISVSQLVCGRIYEPGGSVKQWQKATSATTTPVRIGRPLTHIPAMHMVLWAFPNDRKLRGLHRLLEPDYLRRHVLPCFFPSPDISDVVPQLIRYVPEDRCTVRVSMRVSGRQIALYAKAYLGDEGERTYEVMTALHNADSADLVVPKPIQYSAGILWQEEIEGTEADLDFDSEACARALAALHRTFLPDLEQRTKADLLRRTEEARLQVRTAGLASELLEEVCDELVRRADGLGPLPLATVHGDLTTKNLLVKKGTAALIDLDNVRSGNPLEDLGSLFASIYYRAALQETGIANPDQVAQAFAQAYASGVPWRVHERDLAWYCAHALISERVSCCIKQQKPGTAEIVVSLVMIAKHLLDKAVTAHDVMRRFAAAVEAIPGKRVDVHYRTYRARKSWHKSYVTVAYRSDDGGDICVSRSGAQRTSWVFPNDPTMPWLRSAVEPELVKQLLPVPAQNVSVDVLTYRPEERCTLRYRVGTGGHQAVLYGKTYAKDEGRAVHKLLDSLWRLSDGGGPVFPMPGPAGYLVDLKMVWQEEWSGQPLSSCLDRPDAEELLSAAANRLAFLQSSALTVSPGLSHSQQMAELEKKVAKLATVFPEWESRLQNITTELRQRMTDLKPESCCVIHGDFHLRQLVVQGGQVALFDFDDVAVGDPVEDLGHFVADLYSHDLDERGAVWIADSLLRAYQRQTRKLIEEDRLAWHTAVQLLAQAYRSLLHLMPNLEQRANRLLSKAETVLSNVAV